MWGLKGLIHPCTVHIQNGFRTGKMASLMAETPLTNRDSYLGFIYLCSMPTEQPPSEFCQMLSPDPQIPNICHKFFLHLSYYKDRFCCSFPRQYKLHLTNNFSVNFLQELSRMLSSHVAILLVVDVPHSPLGHPSPCIFVKAYSVASPRVSSLHLQHCYKFPSLSSPPHCQQDK